MKVLVVGGAGYIGSHMVQALLDAGHNTVVFDNLSTGFADAVIGGEFIFGDLADKAFLHEVFTKHRFDAVMHFASSTQVGESIAHPGKYYQNNVANTLNLLEVMIAHDVKALVFSSTAAIFGEPTYVPIDEAHEKRPINPYGWSKWMIERMLLDFDYAYGLKSVCLRYFNAAGAHPLGLLGERHEPETHLIPLVLQVASGRRTSIDVFGRDYDTEDGTCVRDYVHILDLCDAHLLALSYLRKHGRSGEFNLGNGRGFSVQQVIRVSEAVTGKAIRVNDAPRRAGDPARLVADAELARAELGWQPRFHELETIIEHAWAWEQHRSDVPLRVAAR